MPVFSDYQPQDFEKDFIIEDLAEARFSSQRNPNKTPYTIVMPPPNITGMLHMGHILNNTIQDILIRYKRMDGFEACWIPGLDHASIATEAKVTQWLSEQGIEKNVIGRSEFINRAMQWKEEYGGIINNQLKRLGVSCDWDRERFTLDKEYTSEVLKSFIDLYNAGLIYRGLRMVNWCPISCSAISDEEVIYQEEQGHLWYFAYPIKDSNEKIIIATTRPETMFGDMAVMVNSADLRYKHLLGKTIILPFVHREIPIIADDIVDPEFGTGAVKVTPAHDRNDYDVGVRHHLEMPIVMTDSATMNELVPEEFRGLDRFLAREKVINEIKKLGLFVKSEIYSHNVGYSQRGGVPIETILSTQWFMSMKNMALRAKQIVKDKEILFFPAHWEKTYFYWLDNIRDWCISRQLWWGHRLPIYYCDACNYEVAQIEKLTNCPKCNGKIFQDESVLDTWASSWLWSYAVHKYEEDRVYYHPTDTLVTGPDIIFFWVARMIMAAEYFRKEIPFKNVYFTGIIRDHLGRKMSKSLGNSPDPLDIIEQYGADALRFSIVRFAPLGNDILYSSEGVELGRKFANKLWNAARFLSIHLEKASLQIHEFFVLPNFLDDADKSMLTRLNYATRNVRSYLDTFKINEAVKEIYNLVWSYFCDHYIEHSKLALESPNLKTKVKVMAFIFRKILRILHPVMPFITEKISRDMFFEPQLLFAAYPQYSEGEIFDDLNKKMFRLERLISMVREIYASNNLTKNKKLKSILSTSKELQDFFRENISIIKHRTGLKELEIVDFGRELEFGETTLSEPDFQIFINLAEVLDKSLEMQRLNKELTRLENLLQTSSSKFKNKQFLTKAPANIVKSEKAKIESLLYEIEKIKQALDVWK